MKEGKEGKETKGEKGKISAGTSLFKTMNSMCLAKFSNKIGQLKSL